MKRTIITQFPANLRYALFLRKVTQAVLAERIGVNKQSVNHYCMGRALPSLETFAKICLALDYPAHRLLVEDISGLAEEVGA